MFASISWPVITEVHLGPLSLRPHGLLIAMGFLAGAVLMRRSTRRIGVSDDDLWHVLGWGLVGGVVGMRLAWVLGHTDEMRSALDLVAVWQGGMSLLGGLIGGVLVGAVAARRRGLPLVPLLDLAAPGLALGIAIGRLSDLIIGDHLGRPTSLPWGFRYVGGAHPLAGVPELGAIVHPVALYDLLLTSLLLLVLLWFARSRRAPGSAIALFVLWYGATRITTDFLRTDPPRLAGLTGSQLTAILAVSCTLVILSIRRRRSGAPSRTEPAESSTTAAPSRLRGGPAMRHEHEHPSPRPGPAGRRAVTGVAAIGALMAIGLVITGAPLQSLLLIGMLLLCPLLMLGMHSGHKHG